jgi:hypothetical protein
MAKRNYGTTTCLNTLKLYLVISSSINLNGRSEIFEVNNSGSTFHILRLRKSLQLGNNTQNAVAKWHLAKPRIPHSRHDLLRNEKKHPYSTDTKREM